MITKTKRSRKSSFETYFFSVFFAILFLLVIGFLIYSNWKIGQRRLELNAQIRALKQEIQTLEQKRKELQAQISRDREEEFLEKEARERFNLRKPGEEVVTVLPKEKEEPLPEKERIWWNPLTW